MIENKKHISIVIPVYMGEGILYELIERINKTVSLITNNYEIILIEDASTDNSRKEIENIYALPGNENLVPVYHIKNMGQHVSILDGLKICKGEWVIIMDCDMQDLPEEIPVLFAETFSGNKIILAKRKNKQFPFYKKFYSTCLNVLLFLVSAKKYSSSTGNFGIYDKEVINTIKNIPDNRFYLPAAIRNAGFPIKIITIVHGKRKAGGSTYRVSSLLKLSLLAIRAANYKIKTIAA